MSDMFIDEAINRFLSWQLPDTFNPDCGIHFDGAGIPPNEYKDSMGHVRSWPVGTNLFSATETKAMLEHVLGVKKEEAPPHGSLRWRLLVAAYPVDEPSPKEKELLREAAERIRTLERRLREQEGCGNVPDVDWLANVIRSVDGSNTLGAGLLAEKIVAAISAAPNASGQDTYKSGGYWLIYFDDAGMQPEIFTDEQAARKRYHDISGSWNAHLFERIECNSMDAAIDAARRT